MVSSKKSWIIVTLMFAVSSILSACDNRSPEEKVLGFNPKDIPNLPLADRPSEDGRIFLRCKRERDGILGKKFNYRVYRIDTEAKTLHLYSSSKFVMNCKSDDDCHYQWNSFGNCNRGLMSDKCDFNKDSYSFKSTMGDGGKYQRIFYRESGKYIEQVIEPDGSIKPIGEWPICEAIVNPTPRKF